MAKNTIEIVIKTDSASAQKGLASVGKAAGNLAGSLGKLANVGDVVKSSLGKIASGLGNIASIATGMIAARVFEKITSGFVGMGRTALDSYAAHEKLTMSIESLVARELKAADSTMSMEDALKKAGPRAQELVKWTQQLAIASPFDQVGVANAFRTAVAYGFTTDEAKRLTKATLDMTAATGGTTEQANRAALALGQIRAKGKVSAEELNQLREAGFDANAVLARMGYTLDDVADGLVNSNDFIEEATKLMEDDFGGAAERMSGTFSGLLNSLSDLKEVGLREFFTGTFQAIQPFLQRFVDFFANEETLARIRGWGDALGQFIGDKLAKVEPIVIGVVSALQLIGKAISGASLSVRDAIPLWASIIENLGPDFAYALKEGIEIFNRFKTAFQEGNTLGESLMNIIKKIGGVAKEGWEKYVVPKLNEWKDKFWEWATGTSGVALSTPAKIDTIVDKISEALFEGWPKIRDTLREWAMAFWDWIIEDVIPASHEKLNAFIDAIRMWAESDAGRGRLQEIGQSLSDGLMGGIEDFIKDTETAARLASAIGSLLADVVSQLDEIASQVGGEIGSSFVSGLTSSVSEKLNIELPAIVSEVVEDVSRNVLSTISPKRLALGTATLGASELYYGGSELYSGFASGGIVPGPIGSPQLIMAHGGEPIGSQYARDNSQQNISITFNGMSAPTNSTEANNSAFMLINGLRARGVSI